MLQKVGRFNDLPQSIIPKPLKRGEVVVYEITDYRQNPNPPGTPNRGPERIYNSSIRIPTRDTIKLPDGRLVEIGVVEEVKDDEVVRTKRLTIQAASVQGRFAVTGGDVESEKFYAYLEICNFNASNPNRDTTKETIFRRVDVIGDSDKTIDKTDRLAEALIRIKDMSTDELRVFGAGLGFDSSDHPKMISARLREMAMKDPMFILDQFENPDLSTKAIVKRSIELGIVAYVAEQRKFIWKNGQTIATVELVEGQDYLESMLDWIKTHPNGQEVRMKIEKLTKAENKKAKAAASTKEVEVNDNEDQVDEGDDVDDSDAEDGQGEDVTQKRKPGRPAKG